MKNLTFKISMLILGLFVTAFAANAQQIKGVVTDASGVPQIGVSVFVEGTTLGVSTGLDGDYVSFRRDIVFFYQTFLRYGDIHTGCGCNHLLCSQQRT